VYDNGLFSDDFTQEECPGEKGRSLSKKIQMDSKGGLFGYQNDQSVISEELFALRERCMRPRKFRCLHPVTVDNDTWLFGGQF